MAKASDNPFPSLLVVEGSAPAAPAAGRKRLFIDSADHTLKTVDSAGAVAAVGGGGGGGAATTWVRQYGGAAADYSTIATAFADLDNTYFSKSIAAVAGDELQIEFIGFGYNDTVNKDVTVTFMINGTVPTTATGGAPGGIARCDAAGTLYPINAKLRRTVVAGDLSAGLVPVKVQWRTNSGSVGGHIRSLTSGVNAGVPLLIITNYGQ